MVQSDQTSKYTHDTNIHLVTSFSHRRLQLLYNNESILGKMRIDGGSGNAMWNMDGDSQF